MARTRLLVAWAPLQTTTKVKTLRDPFSIADESPPASSLSLLPEFPPQILVALAFTALLVVGCYVYRVETRGSRDAKRALDKFN